MIDESITQSEIPNTYDARSTCISAVDSKLNFRLNGKGPISINYQKHLGDVVEFMTRDFTTINDINEFSLRTLISGEHVYKILAISDLNYKTNLDEIVTIRHSVSSLTTRYLLCTFKGK